MVRKAAMPMTLEQWYRQMPVVTRSYLTLSFLTTAGCALELISPFSVYYNSNLIFRKGQVWRLATNFFFFGSLGMDFVFHMFFLSRYCRLLEEGTFRGRSGDFFWMLVFGAAALSAVAPFVNIQFLGSSLTFMMVYVWGRRNRYVNMSCLGLFSFTAPYLPWVLLAFSAALGSSPTTDLLGVASGHRASVPRRARTSRTGRRAPSPSPRRPGQQKGDSTSLQRECSARARSGKSIHASRPFREMIARPKISRNEWKTAEKGAFEVGNFALLSCPGSDVAMAVFRRSARCCFEPW